MLVSTLVLDCYDKIFGAIRFIKLIQKLEWCRHWRRHGRLQVQRITQETKRNEKHLAVTPKVEKVD